MLIGGSGEKKTIPLAARHFDHLNLIIRFDEAKAKMDVVRRTCEDIGRDPATLETTMLITVLPTGFPADQLPDDLKQRTVTGSPEAIAEQIKTKVLDAGIGG